MSRRFATLVALTAAAMALAAAPVAAKRTVPAGFFGADYDREAQWGPANVQTKMWSTMAQSGVESARVIFDWRTAQPRKDQPPSFAESDRFVSNAAAHGIQLLPIVMLAPTWARVLPDQQASAPSDIPAYTDYLKGLIGRYGPSGSFWTDHPKLPRLPVRAWQIWNEPDMPYQWQPRENWQARYGELLRPAEAAVHQADPGATVVLAALTNESWTSLGQLYAKGGIRGHFGAVGLNVYTRVPSHLTEILRRGRNVMNQNGGKKIPIWVTEFGASASKGRIKAPGNEHLQTTDKGLASLVRRGYDLLAKNRRKLGIGRAFWYTWASSYDTRKAIFDFAGLMRYGAGKLDGRPALSAYRTSARAHEGCVKDARAACRHK